MRSPSCARPGGSRRSRAASAARWFGAALRLLPESAPPEERVGLLLARAEALGATGRLEESRADLLESLELVPAELVACEVRLTVACAGMEHMLGRHREARARIPPRSSRSRIPRAGGGPLMIVLAFDGLFRTDFDAMREAAARALDAARPLGDRPLDGNGRRGAGARVRFGGRAPKPPRPPRGGGRP